MNMIDFEWWMVHIGVVAGWPLLFLLVLLEVPLTSGIAIYGMAAWGVVFGLGSFFAIHHDAKQLHEADAPWQPHRVLWLLVNLVIGPYFISPLYLLMRFVRITILSDGVSTPT